MDSSSPASAMKSDNVPVTLNRTALAIGKKYTGKVRDVYDGENQLVLVTTDRLSAFDRLLACVPYKGQVLNLTSAWWFNATKHIVPNHVVAVPHPNVTIAKKCTPFKIEFVVRAYLTGTTSTSIWVHYKAGAREYTGHALPEGMKKNQPLPSVIVTPTTKEDTHDRPISAAEIVAEGWMNATDWEYTSQKALELFAFGQKEAAQRGLILVDTKYEFGKDGAGVIHVIDEIHTPDSSRYWIAESYAARLAEGREPENIDKEFLRIWFRDNCDPYRDVNLPDAPPSLVAELSRRYIMLYERITGNTFVVPAAGAVEAPTGAAISRSLAPFFAPAHRRIAVLYQREHEAAEAATRAVVAAAIARNAGHYQDGVVASSVVASPGSGAVLHPEHTRLAVEHYGVDVATGTLPLLQLCRDLAAENSVQLRTVVVVVAVGRIDDIARLVATQSRLPCIALLSESGGGGGHGGLSLEVQANVCALAGSAVLGGVGVQSVVSAAARIMGIVE